MKKYLLLLLMGVSVNTLADDSLITPGDMPEEAQNTMFNISMDYNKCMMQSRLEASTQQRAVQEAADGILQKCETHLDDMKALLSSNHVNEELVVGMTKKMRSRAARELMTKSMNNMAAQASAVINAEKIKAENN
jgi:N-methylhydantoinase B/oxoprolinase/acetone carboxylase alpha subunit